MKEFSPQQIEQTKLFFESKKFPVEHFQLGSLEVSYFVIPQAINPGLQDFALRMTNTNPDTKEVFGIFGVSDSIPVEIRPYWAAHEIVEFTEIGISTNGRCKSAEKEVLSLMPDSLKEQYVQRRITFFANLIDFFRQEITKNRDSYSQDDVSEAEKTLNYLNQTVKSPK
jgi:hypothetical protein